MQTRALEEIELEPPSLIARTTLLAVCGLFLALLAWAAVGEVDVVATAEGRLVPQTFVKIVQPADAGVVKDILVKEGERVREGQVLMRMDTQLSDADEKTLEVELANRELQLRRIDAELVGKPMLRKPEDAVTLFAQIEAQYRARQQNYLDLLAQEQQTEDRARHDLSAAQEVRKKLQQSVPILEQQAKAYGDLGREGFAGNLMVQEKLREFQERAQDLKAQEATVQGANAAVLQSQKRLEQISSNYRSTLQNERVEAEGQYQKLQQDWAKQQHKAQYLELKAPQAGLVKDLATHTSGTVVTPGTVLLTLVPEDEPLLAEVQVKNEDVGFVHARQTGMVKLVAYPFQKYGMLQGEVIHLGADAQDGQKAGATESASSSKGVLTYKALLSLSAQKLQAQGEQLKLVPGMQVVAEIKQGRRTVLEYLLSPVQKAFVEGGRER